MPRLGVVPAPEGAGGGRGGTRAGLLLSRLSAQEGARQHPHSTVLKGSQSQLGLCVASSKSFQLRETQFPHLGNGEGRSRAGCEE